MSTLGRRLLLVASCRRSYSSSSGEQIVTTKQLYKYLFRQTELLPKEAQKFYQDSIRRVNSNKKARANLGWFHCLEFNFSDLFPAPGRERSGEDQSDDCPGQTGRRMDC